MKKLGFILIALFASIAINLSAQSDTQTTVQDSAVVQALDATAGTDQADDAIDKLIEKALSAKIEDLAPSDNPPTAFMGTFTFMVIVLPTLIVFTAVVLIVFFVLRHKKGREKARYDIYMKSLELGQQLPDKFFEEPKKRSSSLKKGAIWLAVGISLIIWGLVKGNNSLMEIGAFPTCVGIAFLVVYFIERKQNNDESTINE